MNNTLKYMQVDTNVSSGSKMYVVISTTSFGDEFAVINTLAPTKEECQDLFCEGLSYTASKAALEEVKIVKVKLVEVSK